MSILAPIIRRISNCWSAVKRFSAPYVYSAGGATFITLMLIIVGGLGSIASPDIRASFPFAGWFQFSGWSWWAFWWWILALLTAFLFFLRQIVVDEARQKAETRLKGHADRLETLVRTMPPENFLEEFAKAHAICDLAVDEVFEEDNQQIAPRAIRLILGNFLLLAKTFHGNHGSARYAANIMVFRASDDLTEEERQNLRAKMLFAGPSTTIEALRGVLELVPQYSTAQLNGAEQDPHVRPICLPIPLRSRSQEDRYLFLPGAPFACLSGQASCHSDAKQLHEWMTQHGDFTREVTANVRSYFGQHGTVRSFLSIPLFEIDPLVSPIVAPLPAQDAEAGDGAGEAVLQVAEPVAPLLQQEAQAESPVSPTAFAVLNIHCNHAGILRTDESINDGVMIFTMTVRPMTLLLTKLLGFALAQP